MNNEWYCNLTNGSIGGPISTGGVNLFRGWIDDVRIWNRALTASEITANAVKELNGNETGLIHYWKCEEETGTLLEDSSPTNPLKGFISGTGVTWTKPYVPPFRSHIITPD